MSKSEYEQVAVRAVDCIMSVNPKRIRKAQAGKADSASVGIPWRRFLLLVEAVEAANPGWIERAHELSGEVRTR